MSNEQESNSSPMSDMQAAGHRINKDRADKWPIAYLGKNSDGSDTEVLLIGATRSSAKLLMEEHLEIWPSQTGQGYHIQGVITELEFATLVSVIRSPLSFLNGMRENPETGRVEPYPADHPMPKVFKCDCGQFYDIINGEHVCPDCKPSTPSVLFPKNPRCEDCGEMMSVYGILQGRTVCGECEDAI